MKSSEIAMKWDSTTGPSDMVVTVSVAGTAIQRTLTEVVGGDDELDEAMEWAKKALDVLILADPND